MAHRAARKWRELAAMKLISATRIFTLAAALLWSGLAHSQMANGEQRTHGVNAPGTSIGPSPGMGTPQPRLDAANPDEHAINSKSPAAGAGIDASANAVDNAGGAMSGPTSGASNAQDTQANASGIWPFALPIAAIFVGMPLAFMFWMRRSKTKKEN